MSNMLSRAMSQLGAALKQHAGQQITYTNGVSVWQITATRTRPQGSQLDDTDGLIFASKHWHWIIAVMDLDGLEPQMGHMITDQSGTQYRVQPSNPNDLAYRWCDGQETLLRIFTEQVS